MQMTQTSINYGRILYELSVSPEAVSKTQEILEKSPRLCTALESPLVSLQEKESLIARIFPKEMKSFLIVVCKYGHAPLWQEIFRAYQEYKNQQHKILNAVLYYVAKPTEQQLQGIRKFLCGRYRTQDAAIEMIEDKSLVGGFILRVNDQEYDYSLKGRINALQQKLIWR